MGFRNKIKQVQTNIKENLNTPQNKAEVEKMKQGTKQVFQGVKSLTNGLLFDKNQTTAVVIEEKKEEDTST